jgi:YegS/Rv2252/BmrU family lipid kinase
MKKNKIFFIINPLHSKGIKKLKSLIKTKFTSDKYDVNILISEYKGHAIKLAKKALYNKANIVVACGGDGTINEIGQNLVKTSVLLGIIPLGSGNGFARHFNIPRNLNNALNIISENFSTIIDVGKINNTFFFSNFGLGVEARFIHEYSKKKIRGLKGYIISFFKTIYLFKKQKIEIEFNSRKKKLFPFLFLVSNTSQQGYNFSITPKAKANDGKLELVYTENNSLLVLFYNLIISLLIKRKSFQLLKYSKLNKISITKINNTPFCLQIDGEILNINKKKIVLELVPKSLRVIVPE